MLHYCGICVYIRRVHVYTCMYAYCGVLRKAYKRYGAYRIRRCAAMGGDTAHAAPAGGVNPAHIQLRTLVARYAKQIAEEKGLPWDNYTYAQVARRLVKHALMAGIHTHRRGDTWFASIYECIDDKLVMVGEVGGFKSVIDAWLAAKNLAYTMGYIDYYENEDLEEVARILGCGHDAGNNNNDVRVVIVDKIYGDGEEGGAYG